MAITATKSQRSANGWKVSMDKMNGFEVLDLFMMMAIIQVIGKALDRMARFEVMDMLMMKMI
jgi:hypothetical protein